MDIGPIGVSCIAESMSCNTVITTLSLWAVAAQEAGAAKIASMLQTNTTLTALDLSGAVCDVLMLMK